MYKEIPIRERLWDRYYTGAPCTTEVTRRALQKRQESLKALSERYGTNHKTVATWRKRDVVHDVPMGPKQPHSTVLSLEEKKK